MLLGGAVPPFEVFAETGVEVGAPWTGFDVVPATGALVVAPAIEAGEPTGDTDGMEPFVTLAAAISGAPFMAPFAFVDAPLGVDAGLETPLVLDAVVGEFAALRSPRVIM